MIEKSARKPSTDPAQEKLRQDKASWNKEVSLFLNDVIHLKKMMNGWPSKFFKERSRITQPIPADPATIIGTLANDFAQLAQRGEGIVQEQLNYAKTRRQKQPKAPVAPPTAPEGTGTAAAPPAAPAPTAPPTGADLSKQLAAWESKYSLVSEASNPISRLITKILTYPGTIGWGEGVRIRRLRMTLLRGCVETLRALKRLQKEIVKSSDASIAESHKIMTDVWNHWTVVARGFQAAQMLRPQTALDAGGDIDMLTPEEKEEVAQQKALEGGNEQVGDATYESVSPPDDQTPPDITQTPGYLLEEAKRMMVDFQGNMYQANVLANKDPAVSKALATVYAVMDKYVATPKISKHNVFPELKNAYLSMIGIVNGVLGTSGSNLREIVMQAKAKAKAQAAPPAQGPTVAEIESQLYAEAQLGRWLGKLRHQMVPGATSGTRLEVYRMINQTKSDLNHIMDWLEKGWYPEQLGQGIPEINRQITSLRALTRSLAATEGPKHEKKEKGKK
jgi:hypothetical protein